MKFKFTCGICKKEVKQGKKFSVDSTEWESESCGSGGDIDEENMCKSCHDDIAEQVRRMRK